MIQFCAERLGLVMGVDVLMLSEVPKEAGKARVSVLADALRSATGAEWEVLFSEPSGVGPKDNQSEYHAALVKTGTGLKIESTYTHMQSSNGTKNDHAPFSVFLLDNRFEELASKRVCVTSVHFPPKSRRRDLVVQGKRFMADYAAQLDWPKNLKLRRPTTFSGPSRPFCTCVVGGDFNCSPQSELGLDNQTWTTLRQRADLVRTQLLRQLCDQLLVVKPGSTSQVVGRVCPPPSW